MKLARDPAALSAVKAKLAGERDVAPLFDTARFTRNLESAFTTMWERAQRGAPAESFAVAAARHVTGHNLDEAWRLHRAGEHDEAEQLYREIIRADPRTTRPITGWHSCMVNAAGGRMRSASWRARSRSIRGAADALFLRGAALQKLHRHEEAVGCFDRALALNPASRRGTAEPGGFAVSPAAL